MKYNDKYIYVNECTSKLLQSIKSEREKRGLLQKELADILGISCPAMCSYEKGSHSPTLGVFLRLAEFFEWDISRNVNFLFTKYGQDTCFLRRLKEQYGLSNRKLTALTRQSSISYLFLGKGSIENFAKFLHVIYYFSRKKVLS